MTAVYDRQRWACIHEDEISDKLVQEKAFGLFSNAYLAVASKEQRVLRQYLQNTTVPEKKNSRSDCNSGRKWKTICGKDASYRKGGRAYQFHE